MSLAGAETDLGEPPEPERLSLAAGFPAATRAHWQEQVLAVLRKSGRAGADTAPGAVEDLLTTTTYDGIAVRPLYTAADLVGEAVAPVGVPGLAPYVRGTRPQGGVQDGWDIRARHAHPDPKVTNDAALADLENGATSLWLVLGDGGLPVDGLTDALAGVYLDLAPVVLDAGADTTAAAQAFLALADDRGVPPASLLGELGADPLGLVASTGGALDLAPAVDLARRCVDGFPQVRAVVVDALPYNDAGGSDAQELGASIATGVAYLRALTGAGLSVDDCFRQIGFRYAATADQFLTIAKLRAARRLWARVGEVSGADPAVRAQHQHAVTAGAMMTRRDPYVNMLRTTLACFAAGIGGADAVSVLPFDTGLGLPDDFSRRIARNTQSLLQQESSLIRVVDPAGGSWYVEKLTADLAEAGWAAFTEIERAGGMAAALASGLVADRLAATWDERADAVAHRRQPIIGVSEFPAVAEKLPVRAPAPDRPGGGLPKRRYAAGFEDLRDRTDAVTERPTVFLATLGSIASSSARTSFAANLFAAGGLVTTASGAGTDPAEIAAAFTASGAAVACLCGNDKVYAEHAAPVAAALRAAGVTRLWLAGKPSDPPVEGVDGYLFAGCDALAVLTATLTDLGVA